jgi:hypothetical protein
MELDDFMGLSFVTGRDELLRGRPVPAQGRIAQQTFWYTAFTSDMVRPEMRAKRADSLSGLMPEYAPDALLQLRNDVLLEPGVAT